MRTDADVIVGDDLTVTGNTYLSSSVEIAGDLTGVNTGSFYALNVGDRLSIDDSRARIYLSGTISSIHSTGSVTIDNDLSVGDDVTITGDLNVSQYINHSGDANTYVEFQADEVRLIAGGKAGLVLEEDSVDTVYLGSGPSDAFALPNAFERILVLSGGHGTHKVNPANATDLNFFVSGAVGSKNAVAGNAARGAAVFGGDVVVSGTIYDGSGGAITGGGQWTDGGSFLYPTDNSGVESVIIGNTSVANADIVLGSDGAATFNEQAADVDFRVESVNNAHMLFVDAGNDRLGIGKTGASPGTTVHVKDSSPTVRIQRNSNSEDSTLDFAGSAGAVGAVMHLARTNDLVFKTHDGSSPAEMFRIGSHYGSLNRQIIFLSGSGLHAGAMQPKEATDIAFFVSGAVGSKNAVAGDTARGAAVLGGDAVVSGALYVSDPGVGQDVIFYGQDSDAVGLQWDADSDEHGRLTLGSNDHGVDFKVFGETASKHLHWDQSADTFYLWGSLNTRYNQVFDGSSQGWDFTVNSNSRVGVFVDGSENQVYILSGGDGTGPSSPNPANATDLAFFVSGTIDSKGTSNKGTSLFGGDVVVSGGLYLDERVEPGAIADGTVALYGKDDGGVTKLYFKNENGEVEVGTGTGGSGTVTSGSFNVPSQGEFVTTASLSLAGGKGFNYTADSVGTDAYFFVSGAIDGKNIHQGDASAGTSVFGGDVIVSGSIFPGLDISQNLGSATNRWANIYTGDLHLKNDRGNWTILEEAEYLCVVNNLTGKRYKMVLEPID
jgi:hypothetical protein